MVVSSAVQLLIQTPLSGALLVLVDRPIPLNVARLTQTMDSSTLQLPNISQYSTATLQSESGSPGGLTTGTQKKELIHLLLTPTRWLSLQPKEPMFHLSRIPGGCSLLAAPLTQNYMSLESCGDQQLSLGDMLNIQTTFKSMAPLPFLLLAPTL
jgi:hypothetical protein